MINTEQVNQETVSFKDAVITYSDDQYEAKIIRNQNAYVLWWGDYVANEWTEVYAHLSTAIARLANLQHCRESDFEEGFVMTPLTFENSIDELFSEKI